MKRKRIETTRMIWHDSFEIDLPKFGKLLDDGHAAVFCHRIGANMRSDQSRVCITLDLGTLSGEKAVANSQIEAIRFLMDELLKGTGICREQGLSQEAKWAGDAVFILSSARIRHQDITLQATRLFARSLEAFGALNVQGILRDNFPVVTQSAEYVFRGQTFTQGQELVRRAFGRKKP